MRSPLFHYVMSLLYMQNTKMAMVNFHFLKIFRNFTIFIGYGQNYLSNSKHRGNTTSEPKTNRRITMKRISILALTFVLTAAMLTACRNDNGADTSASTKLTTAPTTRATTAPTTRPSTSPSTTQRPTDPENTTIGPDGTVGTEGGNNSGDGGMNSDGSGTNGNDSGSGTGGDSTDTTGDMDGRARSGMRNATRSSRRF